MGAATRTTTLFAWHGFQVALPTRWNPVRLEGTFETGQALIADVEGPQLGLRWRQLNTRKLDADAWARRAIAAEIGSSAASRARPVALSDDRWAGSMLCLDSDPPGRDVWAALSLASGRAIEIVHHVRKRDRALEELILPALCDTPPGEPRPWAIFDLFCIVPGDYELKTHRLNAGDLGLTFSARTKPLTLRQIALARLALARLPLEKWLAGQEAVIQRHYRAGTEAETIDLSAARGLLRRSTRRRRFSLLRWLPESVVTIALHDAQRDRLILAQGSDEQAVRSVATTAVARV